MPSKRRYVQIAEKALGREMPKGAIVHHIDQNRKNNRNDNLVILQSYAEHNALHRRLRTFRAGGNPWTQQICCTCKSVKELDQFPPQQNLKYNMQRKCECRECCRTRGRHSHNKKMGRPLNWVESPEEKSLRGRAGALARWGG